MVVWDNGVSLVPVYLQLSLEFPGSRGQRELVARRTVWEEVNNPVSVALTSQERRRNEFSTKIGGQQLS